MKISLAQIKYKYANFEFNFEEFKQFNNFNILYNKSIKE